MTAAVKEVELRDHERLDQHDHRGSHDHKQRNDVDAADDVENDVSWASQAALEESHYIEGRASTSCEDGFEENEEKTRERWL